MCGIAGLIHLQTNAGPFRSALALGVMSRLITHRGPDGSGQWQSHDNQVGLVHRRLAVIDLSGEAAQPMHAANGTTITYNGEIYNYLELRSELSSQWSFRRTLQPTKSI